MRTVVTAKDASDGLITNGKEPLKLRAQNVQKSCVEGGKQVGTFNAVVPTSQQYKYSNNARYS
jgi:hypothetical protein